VDGVNAVFTASKAYSPGSTAVFMNGNLLFDRNVVGGRLWAETTPGSGIITIDTTHVPIVRTSDGGLEEISMFFLDTLPDGFKEVTELQATLRDIDRLGAVVTGITEISAGFRSVTRLSAVVQGVDQLNAGFRDFDRLNAIVEDCP
jgi:hypothetical protein